MLLNGRVMPLLSLCPSRFFIYSTDCIQQNFLLQNYTCLSQNFALTLLLDFRRKNLFGKICLRSYLDRGVIRFSFSSTTQICSKLLYLSLKLHCSTLKCFAEINAVGAMQKPCCSGQNTGLLSQGPEDYGCAPLPFVFWTFHKK